MISPSSSLVKHGLALLVCSAAFTAAPCRAQTDAPPPPAGQAQGPPSGYGPRRGGPEHRAEMLQRQLDLSPDQTTQIRSLLEGERSRMEALHGNAALSQDDMHAQMVAIHQDTDTRLRAVLTPDQLTRYNAMQARMQEHRQEQRNDQIPPPTGSPQP